MYARRPKEMAQRWREAEYRRKARKRALPHEDVDREEVFERDGWICQLCGVPVNKAAKWPAPDFATLDHIKPLAAGGPHTAANLQCAHLLCNMSKGDRNAPRKTVAKNGAKSAKPLGQLHLALV